MTSVPEHPSALPAFHLLKPREVMLYLRISKSLFYRMVEDGTIKAKRVKSDLRIPREEVLRVQRDYFE
jgi:excisionase family DNA binding protein